MLPLRETSIIFALHHASKYLDLITQKYHKPP